MADLERGGSTRSPSPTVFIYTDPNKRIELDAEENNITEWVINHHLKHLIEELEEPKHSIFVAFFSRIYRSLSAAYKPGSQLDPQNRGPPQQKEKRFRISFAELQRMRIRQLQCELVKDVIHMRAESRNSSGWEGRLKEYSRSQSSQQKKKYLDRDE
jgi:hypothetical protein